MKALHSSYDSRSSFGQPGSSWLLWIAVLSATLLVMAGTRLAAQTTETPSDDTPALSFGDQIQVKVINVDVYVRDKKTGEVVTGLTADDFEVYEEKRLMPITNFYEVRDGTRLGDAPVGSREESRGDVVATHPELDRPGWDDVPPDQRLHLIIYVDHQNIRPFNRNRVFRYVREFLRRHIDRTDRVMLVSYNRGDPKIERAFTSDHAVISRALVEMEEHTGGRSQYDSERRDLLRDIEEARDPGLVNSRVRLFAENVYNDMQFTLDALTAMTSDLAGLPGRKAFLYVSDGLPLRAAADMFHAAEEKMRLDPNMAQMEAGGQGSNILDSLQYDTTRQFGNLTRTANANGVTFYTIDAAGLRTPMMRGADVQYSSFSTNLDSVHFSNVQDSIRYMADETGGQSVTNTNGFDKAFEKIAADFDHYYSLGYSPGHSGSGRLYQIEVKLKDKKRRWEVRSREDYRDKPIETEMAETVLASLKFGYGSNEMALQLEPVESVARDDGTFVVTVALRIPINEVTLLPVEGLHKARLRLWVQAADRDGGISPVSQAVIQFDVPEDELEIANQKLWRYDIPLIMKSGDQRLSIGLRDDLGARTSFISQTLRVGS